jgi:hypothetical protein
MGAKTFKQRAENVTEGVPLSGVIQGQQVMWSIAYVPMIILSIVAFLGVVGFLWRKGKTIEALLVWLSMWLYLIALILLLK